jgi:hypothetical protein
MNSPANSAPKKSPLKNPYLYSSIVILAVMAYVAYVLVTRYESNRQFERRTVEKATEQRREDDHKAIEQLGGSELTIRGLYLSPETVHRGETAQLCYDVANAKTVALDPPEAEVWPSHSRCVNLSPKKTTTYTLTIADAAGHTASQSVELKIH